MTTIAKGKAGLLNKLKAACDGMPSLVKNGHRIEFDYLAINDLAEAAHEQFEKHGLLLIPNDVEYREGVGGDVFVKTEFIVTDGKDSKSFYGFGSGRSVDGFALQLAQTFAMKSWLKRLTLIFGEEDNGELEQQKPKANPVVTQRSAWEAALRKSGKTFEQINTYMKIAFHVRYEGPADITALSSSEFSQALQWLTTNGELSKTMELSKQAAAAKRSQPIVIDGSKPQPVVSIIDPNMEDEIEA